MIYLYPILTLVITGARYAIVGAVVLLFAYLFLGMFWQAGRELWRRHKERQQSPFQLVVDERYRPLAVAQTVEGEQPGDEFRPYHVKASNK